MKKKIIITLFSYFAIFSVAQAQKDPVLIQEMNGNTDTRYELGMKRISTSNIEFIATMINDGTNILNFEFFGRIPVKSWFSVNIGTGYGHSYRQYNRTNDISRNIQRHQYKGGFLKTGIYKTFGIKRFRPFLGMNHVLATVKNKTVFHLQDYQYLYPEYIFTHQERKTVSALEWEIGFEVFLGKHIYFSSSMILNTDFNSAGKTLDSYRFNVMPGLSGLYEQEEFRMNWLNLSYKF